jgi:8-oxo-dGTP pyrophosphatase MutT (NUDIX family)
MSKKIINNRRMRPAVKALIVHKKKILIIHERVWENGVPINIIDFPGGGVKFGENLSQALKREVKEEVGLNIELKNVVGAWSFIFKPGKKQSQDNEQIHIVCIAYQCSITGESTVDISKNPAKDENIFAAEWLSKEEILGKKNWFARDKNIILAIQSLNID